MEITAKSLILDLLAFVRRGDMPVAALVEAAGMFGIAENNVRVTVSKLFASGEIVRDERGFYRLAQERLDRVARITRSSEAEVAPGAWRGGWIAVHAPRLGRGAPRARRERALDRLGFRELESGLYVRPDNRRGGIAEVRASFADHVPASDEAPLIYGVHDLGEETELRARRLWDHEDLPARHAALCMRLERSQKALEAMAEHEACVEGFVLGGEAARQLTRDPGLPPEISDPAPRRALLDQLRAYERVARRVWQPLMRRHGLAPSVSGLSGRFHAGMAS